MRCDETAIRRDKISEPAMCCNDVDLRTPRGKARRSCLKRSDNPERILPVRHACDDRNVPELLLRAPALPFSPSFPSNCNL